MAEFQAHIVGHRQGPEPRRVAGAEIAVDVALAETGVLDRPLSRLGVKLGERFAVGLACRMLINADDISLPSDAHRGLVLPFAAKAVVEEWDTVARLRSIPDCHRHSKRAIGKLGFAQRIVPAVLGSPVSGSTNNWRARGASGRAAAPSRRPLRPPAHRAGVSRTQAPRHTGRQNQALWRNTARLSGA